MKDRYIIFTAVFALFFRVIFSLDDNDLKLGKQEFIGCIEEVDIRDRNVKYTLGIDGYDARVLLNSEKYPIFEYGDCLQVVAEIKAPGEFLDFDYGDYLSVRNIYGVVSFSESVKFVGVKKNWFFEIVYVVRKEVLERLNRVFPEPYSSFMAGLIVGSRKGISANLMQDFNAAGLTHILAISGYNITLIILIVSNLLGFLARGKRIFWSIVFIVLFVIIVGASASVVRAALMGIISVISLWFGRKYFVLRALFFSGFLMVLCNPGILLFDISFQLSFLATLGIVLFAEFIGKFVEKVPEAFKLRENLKMTLCAQILTLPILLMNFQQLSLVSVFANLLVLPFIPFAMLFGFCAFLLSFISFNLALGIGFFGYIILKLVTFIVGFFGGLNFAYVEISWFSGFFLAVYFLLTFLFWRKFC